jgi:Cu-Zn family superoxide dismutase
LDWQLHRNHQQADVRIRANDAGDMGNIEPDLNWNSHIDYIGPVMKLNGKYSIIGHAVIVHEKEDDFKTQPSGNAEARIGYGVIGIAK